MHASPMHLFGLALKAEKISFSFPPFVVGSHSVGHVQA